MKSPVHLFCPRSDAIKRLVDLAISSCAVLFLFPVLSLIAVAIRLDSPGPVLYWGPRVGRPGRPISILKFRTMVVGADSKGGTSTPKDDPRLTRVGRLLRGAKLDELPQFISVLIGDMSLVGPRPQVAWAVALYTPNERQLLTLRPGITDYASIRFSNEAEILAGQADPDRAYLELIAPEKIRLGLLYVSNRSLCVDIKILTATAFKILGLSVEWALPQESRLVDGRELGGAENGRG